MKSQNTTTLTNRQKRSRKNNKSNLDQLHNRGQTTVSRVAVGNNGTHKVDGFLRLALLARHPAALLTLRKEQEEVQKEETLRHVNADKGRKSHRLSFFTCLRA